MSFAGKARIFELATTIDWDEKVDADLHIVQKECRGVGYWIDFRVIVCAIIASGSYLLSEPPNPRTGWYTTESSTLISILLSFSLVDMKLMGSESWRRVNKFERSHVVCH